MQPTNEDRSFTGLFVIGLVSAPSIVDPKSAVDAGDMNGRRSGILRTAEDDIGVIAVTTLDSDRFPSDSCSHG